MTRRAANVVAVDRWVFGHQPDLGTRVLEIALPLRLGSPQNGSHGHWAVRAKERAKTRHIATWGCSAPLAGWREALAEGRPVALVVTLTRVAPRQLDDDNLVASCKAVRDGVADALGLRSDRDPRVRWAYAQERGKPKEYAVRVTVQTASTP